MKIDVSHWLNEDDYRDAWQLYTGSFAGLDGQAIQAHLMPEEAFSDIRDDKAIEKHMVRDDDGRMIGLSVLTNRLESWPLVSAAALRNRYPAEAAAGRIWYVGFVCVEQSARGMGAFPALLESMTDGRRDDGIFIMDYCQERIQQGIVRSVQLILTRINGTEPAASRLDSQEFWAVDFRR